MQFSVQGNIIDIQQQTIQPGTIKVADGVIQSILTHGGAPDPILPYILPGFVDAHVHIESSLLIPSEFARMAVVHGTVATVSDPHEIANVCGMEGVEYMIENGKTVPFYFNFGAPSCVPATIFETAGAVVTAAQVEALMARPEIRYLSEVMNFPGVLHGDADMLAKIAAAKKWGKPIDGHAPGLRGEDARCYIAAGPSTDHECFTEAEAREKLELGMKVLIREGSAAKNFEALISLLHEYPDQIMFCSDDKHPDSLLLGHINQLCARAVAEGIPLFHVLQAACINPVLHYGLANGLLREGDAADFIVVQDLNHFLVRQTYIQGALVAENGRSLIERNEAVTAINNFNCSPRQVADFAVPANTWTTQSGDATLIPVIEALEGQLITNKLLLPETIEDGLLVSNTATDILKIVVVNRYQDAPVAKAFIKNFGLKRGALASSVAHDSHNIVAVGVDDESICKVVNALIEQGGGLAVTAGTISGSANEGEPTSLKAQSNTAATNEWNELNTPAAVMQPGEFPNSPEEALNTISFAGQHIEYASEQENLVQVLPLPVGGIMSNEDAYQVAEQYTALDAAAKALGTPLAAPFMTLSFMALLVIPHLKLSDKGLFDGDSFSFVI